MNIFVPQTIQTKFELEEIADVKKQLITPSKSVTIYGLVQDGLIGTYNLTHDKTRINWRDAMNIISYTTFDDFGRFEKNRDYTGAELFSMIIPPRVTTKIGEAEIKNGELIKGKVNESALKAGKKNNLIQYIRDEYGEDAMRNFVDNAQKLANNFNLWNGFTVGVVDARIDATAKKDMNVYIENIINKVNVDITSIENNPTYMDVRTFETKIFKDINVVRDDVSKIAMDRVSKKNNFIIMAVSGSKGKPDNLGQMTGCVGLQAFEGGLMPKNYYDRTLCYFHENDDRAKSRGLCYNSFIDGLSYSEFCYHTKAGRMGLIEQTVKTADTGYSYRKLGRTLEDVLVKYDGTVRIANDQIIQQIYGGNGADTTVQYEYKLSMIEMDNKKLEETFKLSPAELKEYSDFSAKDNDALFKTIKDMRDSVRKNFVKAKLEYITTNNAYMLPVNITRIISSMVSIPTSKKDKRSKISPKYIIDQIEDLLSIERTPIVRIPQSMMNNPPELAIQDDKVAKTIMRVALYDALHPKNVILKHKMSKEVFDAVIDEIETNFNNNIIEPGEMIGIIAAQSLGEAVTQMTLNSIHHSGIAKLTHTTAGVPRINELISATKNPKNPQMIVYLDDAHKESREMAHKIGSYIEKTTLGNIRSGLDVFYDPDPYKKGGHMERDNIKEPFYSKKLSRNGCQATINNLPWLLRVVIDKEKMLDKEITLMEIKTKFCMWWDKRHVSTKKKKEKMATLRKITSFAMLSNMDNDPQPIIHIRFNVKDLDKTDIKKSKDTTDFNRKTIIDFIDMIDKFKFKGLENIEAVNVIVKDRYIEATDGDAMKSGEEHVIYASGVNLKEIRYITGINPYKTFSDDILEMYNTFGIEIARNRLICELLKSYENAGNNGLGPQHLSLLADIMCYGGNVISADRHGMKKANVDPLKKASFERTVDVLIAAAVFSDVDKMRSTSSRLFVGSVFRGGTGIMDLQLSTRMIQNSEYIDKEKLDPRETRNDLKVNTIANAIMQDDKGEDIFIP